MKQWTFINNGSWIEQNEFQINGHPQSADTWKSDDFRNDDEDQNPWDGNGNIYSTDQPSFLLGNTLDKIVIKANFREYATLNEKPCSDFSPWHYFVSLDRQNGLFVENAQYNGNEVAAGNLFWGDVPPVFKIKTNILPEGQVGQDYHATLGVEGGTAPITWEKFVLAHIPQGLTVNPDGTVTGIPTTAETVNDVTIIATDSSQPKALIVQKTFTIKINP